MLLLAAGGCVQQAVLENDVRSAHWRARTLATVSNLRQAEAALSAQLVELEALYQRDPRNGFVQLLLYRGFSLLEQGFVEVRRLEAVAAGESATAEQEKRNGADAHARAHFYNHLGPPKLSGTDFRFWLAEPLDRAEAACQKHDRASYEREVNQVLTRTESEPEKRLEHALVQRLAALWLEPRVAERCAFEATSVAPAAPSPASR